MDKPRIAVVGAGLGGVTAAILLEQAGHDIQILEQAPQLARIGAGIVLSPNVLRVMQRAGFEVQVYEQASTLARIGAGIDLGPNSLNVMRHIDALDPMMSIGIVADTALSREWDTGRVLFERSNAGWAV